MTAKGRFSFVAEHAAGAEEGPGRQLKSPGGLFGPLRVAANAFERRGDEPVLLRSLHRDAQETVVEPIAHRIAVPHEDTKALSACQPKE